MRVRVPPHATRNRDCAYPCACGGPADIIPNHTWVDTKNNNRTIMVPGTDLYFRLDRDPYADMVSLAVDLGADGVDLDFEEFWHADYFRQGPRPYDLQQTTYKFAAIVKDVIINIAASSNPNLRLSHAAGATGWWLVRDRGAREAALTRLACVCAHVCRCMGRQLVGRKHEGAHPQHVHAGATSDRQCERLRR